jgi:hypothetical protein
MRVFKRESTKQKLGAFSFSSAYLKEHPQGEPAARDSLSAMLSEEGEGSFMDEYTKGAQRIRENGGV